MNRYLFIIILGFAVACGKPPAPPGNKKSDLTIVTRSSGEVTFRDSLVFDKETGKLFTGLLRDVATSGAGLKAEIYFKDGRRHGLSKEWHDNGEMALQGKWDNGVPIGIISEWFDDGLIRRNTTYQGGQIIKIVEEPSEKANFKINEIVEERNKLNQTVWEDEEQAQQFEATFVKLWDELREKDHDWNVFGLSLIHI